MLDWFHGKTIWITGASSGIGEALARSAAPRASRLILSARRADELQRVADACGAEKCTVIPLDLADKTTIEAAWQAVQDAGLEPDVVVHNGGITQRAPFRDTEIEVVRRVMEVNFMGAVSLTKLVLPGMRTRGHGHFVVISSITGKVGTQMRSAYAASKHALHGFFDALRLEENPAGIQVTIACPGFIRTNVSLNAVTGDGSAHGQMDPAQAKGMDPMLCASRIWQACGHNKQEVIVAGPREKLAVWLKRLAPRLLHLVLSRAKVT